MEAQTRLIATLQKKIVDQNLQIQALRQQQPTVTHSAIEAFVFKPMNQKLSIPAMLAVVFDTINPNHTQFKDCASISVWIRLRAKISSNLKPKIAAFCPGWSSASTYAKFSRTFDKESLRKLLFNVLDVANAYKPDWMEVVDALSHDLISGMSKVSRASKKLEFLKRLSILQPLEATVIFTDGSSIGNPGKCGSCAYFTTLSDVLGEEEEEEEEEECVGIALSGIGTNNKAELCAVLLAVLMLKQRGAACPQVVYIAPDSDYVVKVLTNSGAALTTNQYLITRIREELAILHEPPFRSIIKFERCPGHVGIFGNEKADAIAGECAHSGKHSLNKWLLPTGCEEFV